MSDYLSGFVSIVGCPNVGKSSILNRLVGQKVSIVTNRAQTTRNRITGVLTGTGYQIVFLDTPGMAEAKNRLGEYMRKVVSDSLKSVEGILFVADATAGVRERDSGLISYFSGRNIPAVAAVNKIDAASEEQILLCENRLREKGCFERILRVSAETGDGFGELEEALKAFLTEGPQYFPDDMVTDQPERIICGEIIREKALLLLGEEVPHGIGVSIDRIETREGGSLMDVYATVYCERQSHKGIVIGRNGRMLRKIGSESRKDIEDLLGCHVNLQIWVKVKEDWRNSPSVLHELGYE